jgi:hypothetical protein
VPLHRVGVALALVTEQLAELLEQVVLDELLPVEVADLVAEVAEHRPVGLVHLDAQTLPVDVVALGQVERDDAVAVACGDPLLGARQQVERQAGLRVLLPGRDREPTLVELDDQTTFGVLGDLVLREARRVVVGRSRAGQCAAEAQSALDI